MPHTGRISCNGAVKRVPVGVSFLPADWRVRVSGTFDLVDRPSYHLSGQTILLSRCMDRRCYYNLIIIP